MARFTALCLGRCPDGSLRGEKRARVERKQLMLKAAIRVTGELKLQVSCLASTNLSARIDSLFWLPVPRRCLMKMLPVWYGRNGRQKGEAIERDKQTGAHRGGSDALPSQHRKGQARNT